MTPQRFAILMQRAANRDAADALVHQVLREHAFGAGADRYLALQRPYDDCVLTLLMIQRELVIHTRPVSSLLAIVTATLAHVLRIDHDDQTLHHLRDLPR